MSSAKDVYRRFLDGKLALQEAAAVPSAYVRSGTSPAAGTLALDAIALEAFTDEERQRVGELLIEMIGPISRAFASREVGVEAAARQLAPFTPPHSFFALDDTAPDGSSWSPEAMPRFGELFTRLAELSRSITEVTVVVNRSAPRATVVPILVYEDVGKAIAWLCDTFGFKERLRAAVPGGSVTHAQLDIAEGAVMLGRQGAEFRPPRPNEVSQYVVVHVEDVDKHFEHARQVGARILKSPADMPFGERQYTVEDLGGHRWTFSQSIADVGPEEWGATPARPK